MTASLAVDADRRLRGPGATAVRRPVPSGGRAHAARSGDPEELPVRGRRRASDLDAGGRHRGAGRAHPRGGRLRARALRALGRRRLRGRRAARAQGGRRPAHLRLRRPRASARERGRAGRRDVRRATSACRSSTCRRRSASSPGWPGVTDPEEKRKIVGEEFIRVFEEEARKLGDVRFLVQGTLYSDVIESGGGRGRRRREDQVAPQRRRPSGGHAHGARRAAAPALQGRGASRRRGARPAGADGLAPALPGPGPRDPHHRRGDRGAARDPAPRRRDPARGDPARRPLPRSLAELRRAARRSARSASRATSARMPTRS